MYKVYKTGINTKPLISWSFDWLMFACLLGLLMIGLLAVRSATASFDDANAYFYKQIIALIVGLTGLIIISNINYQIWAGYAYYLYGLGIVLLVLVLITGATMRGTRGWFDFKVFYLQPSEFVKPCIVLALAAYLHKRYNQMATLGSLFWPGIIGVLPCGLILLQPDLSGVLAVFPALFVMLYLSGARLVHLGGAAFFLMISVSIPLTSTFLKLKYAAFPVAAALIKILNGGWNGIAALFALCLLTFALWWFLRELRVMIPKYILFGFLAILVGGAFNSYIVGRVMKDYQRKRLIAFIDPRIDPLGSGYNIRQSVIAVGSGKLFGKGYGEGTQSRLGFLPERHTDFIFAVIAEEFGFFRTIAVLLLYWIMVWRSYMLTTQIRDNFGKLLGCGITTLLAFGGAANFGVVLSMFPVAGVPLPFVSYGGSSLVANLCMMGLLFSMHEKN